MSFDAETTARVIAHMNEDHKTSLVAYAWTFGSQWDVRDAELLTFNSKSLTLALPTSTNQNETIDIPFNADQSPITKAQIRSAFVDLYHSALCFILPPEPIKAFFGFCTLFVLMPLLAYSSPELNSTIPFVPGIQSSVQSYLSRLGLSMAGVFKFSLAFHVFEALIVLSICVNQLKIRKPKVLACRFASTFLFGFFALEPILALQDVERRQSRLKREKKNK